jgi:hypothetical protein
LERALSCSASTGFAEQAAQYITPHFLAFASPVEPGYVAAPGPGSTGNKLPKAFRNVLEHFTDKGVKCVVRLNKKLYAIEHFTERGFEHVESAFAARVYLTTTEQPAVYFVSAYATRCSSTPC